MTDYTDLIARLRYTGIDDEAEAADALEAQARRIAELDKLYLSSEYMRKLKDDRIAELEAALKIYAEARCAGMICAFDDGEAARAALGEKDD